MEIKLRDYQEKQLAFLNKYADDDTAARGQVFSANISLMSPTGSGKSYVILKFIKDYFSKYSNKKIVISTGFNNLVKQFYETACECDIPAIILAGKGRCACSAKLKDNEQNLYDIHNAFYPQRRHKCDPNDCYLCGRKDNPDKCLYTKVINKIKARGNLLIITNHSTLLANQALFQESTNGGFIDECQTFADFYESHLRIEVPFHQLRQIYTYMQNDSALRRSPFSTVFRQACLNGRLTPETINKVLPLATSKKSSYGNIVKLEHVFPVIAKNMYDYAEVEPQTDNYIYPQIIDDEHIGLVVDKFFDFVDLANNYCIVSATVDTYTKSIFEIYEDYRNYEETECHTMDYEHSHFCLYNGMTPANILHFIEMNKERDHGMLLSTRLDLLEKLGEKLGPYDIIDNKKDFVDGKKQILVGSRSLFQGVDIPEVEFVMLNKIPFSRYDEGYKKKMRFFENRGHQSFSFYTKPHTENALIQSMGRLWRKPGDSGNVAIFDSVACRKHPDIIRNALSCRKGIICKEYINGKQCDWRI